MPDPLTKAAIAANYDVSVHVFFVVKISAVPNNSTKLRLQVLATTPRRNGSEVHQENPRFGIRESMSRAS